MYKLINYFTLIVILTGCVNNDHMKKIFVKDETDFLTTTDGKKVELYSIGGLKTFSENNLTVFDNKNNTIYLIDSNYVIKSEYDIGTNCNFAITDGIRDYVLKNEKLYFIDGSDNIKYYNKESDEIVGVKVLWKTLFKGKQTLVYSPFNSFGFISDSTLVISFNYITNERIKANKIIVGIICKLNGEIISSIEIDKNEIEIPPGFFDNSYVTCYNDKIYLTFQFARSIIIYNKYSKTYITKEFLIDPKFWIKPTRLSKNKVQTVKLNYAALSWSNGSFYHTLNQGPNKSRIIVMYNAEAESIAKFVLSSKIDIPDFHLAPTQEYLYAWKINYPNIHKLSKNDIVSTHY